MGLTAMRYKGYVWPHNPATYTIEYERKMAAQKIPFGRCSLQDLGMTRRVMRGEGEFFGPTAYDEFKKLATVFYEGGAGVLLHPVWQSSQAYFVALRLAQEPRKEYVRYTFTFWEDTTLVKTQMVRKAASAPTQEPQGTAPEGSARFHTVESGESLSRIAQKYGLKLEALIALNPQIKNPNLIMVGQQVRVG